MFIRKPAPSDPPVVVKGVDLDPMEKSFLAGLVIQARDILRSKNIKGSLQGHQQHEADLKAAEELLSKLSRLSMSNGWPWNFDFVFSRSLIETQFKLSEKKPTKSKK